MITSSWVVVRPLRTQKSGAKTCGYYDVAFVFSNDQLVTREVPSVLANRGYFKESDLQ